MLTRNSNFGQYCRDLFNFYEITVLKNRLVSWFIGNQNFLFFYFVVTNANKLGI